MDKTVKIWIVRESDSKKFTIGDGSNWKLQKKGLDGFAEVNQTLTYEDNANMDGGVITASHITKVDRTIKFAYLLWRNNDIGRKELTSFFQVKDTFKLYITYGDKTVWAEGQLYKMKIDMTADVEALLTCSVTFLFASPYWSSYDGFGRNIAMITGRMAFPYICANDKTKRVAQGTTGGVFDFSQKVTLNNDGDVYAKPIITILAKDGAVTNPKIIINGEYVRVIDELDDGETIEMDFSAFPPTIRKNGVNYMGHCDRTSAFDGMLLARGDNVIEYDADNGSSHMNVTVYYYKQYGAI